MIQKQFKIMSNTIAESRKKIKKRETKVMEIIAKYQKSTDLVLQKRSFQRLVRSIVQKDSNSLKVQKKVLLILEEVTKALIVELLSKSSQTAMHARGLTTIARDVDFINIIDRSMNKYFYCRP